MAPAYSVSSALTKLPRDGQGLLVAAVDALNSNSITATIIGSVPVAEGSSFDDAAAAVLALLPKGLHVVGSYSSTATSAPWKPPSSSSCGGCPAITASTAGSGAGVVCSVNGQAGGVADSSAAAAAAAGAADADASLDVAPGFVPVRAHADVTLQVLFTPTSNSTSTANGSSKQPKQQQQPVPPAAAIQAAVKQLSQQLFANTQQLVFVPEDSVDASSNNNSGSKQQQVSKPPVIITANSSVSVAEALACSSGGDPCISYRLLQQTSSSASNKPPPAPMFEFTPAASGSSGAQQQVLSLPLSLDVLCYVPTTSTSSSSAKASALQASLLVPALQQQLSQIETQLLQQAAAGRGALHPVKALHFKPPVLGFPLTVCYAVAPGPQEAAEAALLPRRQELHQLLGLPSNVPMLRLANALAWGAAAAAAGPEAAVKGVRLRNVHEGLAPPGFGGQVYLVDGLYDYYHYMQDKFNDAGWGCAYRSLQTIVSWYKLQHYTSKPVPSHRQIQELLVSINARDATLLGSNQWIGAVEVGWFLDEYLGASHKMIIVNQGVDIPQHARALAQHFVTQGTPVSIGGGVLAYTLLGVAFNEDTGEAAFLILDPHYTGGEDLKKVVSGSWVAWKQLGDNAAAGGPLFVKDAFYNFCCPQRPTTV